jgi:2-methylaconitate cis-trans-isomerase PrpF
MTQHAIPAIFMRGGSSKGVFFHARDLPADRADIDPSVSSSHEANIDGGNFRSA